MTQQVKAPVTKPDDPSSVPEPHIVGGDNRLLQIVHICVLTHMHGYTHTVMHT